MNYLDTSALIKRFVTERGSPLIQTIVTRKGSVATAKIAYAEVYAALTRKQRKAISPTASTPRPVASSKATGRPTFAWTCGTRYLLLARDVIQRHPLRGFDAIHLASALALKSALGEEITFAAADERLLRAAQVEGLRPLNVETAPAP